MQYEETTIRFWTDVRFDPETQMIVVNAESDKFCYESGDPVSLYCRNCLHQFDLDNFELDFQ